MARTSRKGKQNKPIETQPKYIAGLYARVSVNDDGKNPSVLNQIEYMQDFVKANGDIAIHNLYIDDGVSSFIKNRPAFTRMLDDVKANIINCVIINDISRFSRNYIEAASYLDVVFPLLQVRVISVFDQYDSLSGNSAQLAIMLKTLLAYSYSKKLSKNIRMLLESKQRNGTYMPSKLPYGYMKIQNNGRVEWAIEEEKGNVVKLIFEMAKQGTSGYSIAGHFNSLEVPSPNGTYWTATGIRRILSNKAYLGVFVTHKTRNELLQDKKVVPLPQNQWFFHEGHHDPIIENDLFNSVQQRLQLKKKIPSKGNAMNDFFLGKLYCGMCGRKLRQKKANDGALYYICPMRDGVSVACDNKSRRSEKLKLMILHEVKEKIRIVRERREALARFENSHYYKHKKNQHSKTLTELKQQSEFHGQLLTKLMEERINSGEPPSDDLHGLHRHLTRMREYFHTQTATLDKEECEIESHLISNKKWMNHFLEYEQEIELSLEMMDVLVEKVLVLPNDVQVIYKTL